MFAKQNGIEGGELGARMAVVEKGGSGSSLNKPLSLQKALAAVNGSSGGKNINIRGASGVTVEVRELVKGTTAADVEAIFKRCGNVTGSKLVKSKGQDSETVHIKFENQDQASRAVQMFNNQAADGRILQVEVINNGLSAKGTGIESIDALLEDENNGGSKLRSDAILATDSRAQVMTNPWGKSNTRGGRRRRGGRGGKIAGGDMHID